MRRSPLARSLLCLAASAGWAWAQPADPPKDAPPADPTAGQVSDTSPEALRERVRTRLDRAKENITRLEHLLDRIEAGESIDPAELNELMPPDRPFRERMGEALAERRGGPMRDGAPGTGPGAGPGAGPGPGFGRPDAAPDITVEDVRAFIKSELPWLEERLSAAETSHPGVKESMIERIRPQIAEIMETRRDDPELATLKIAQFRLGADWIETSRTVREDLRSGEMTREQAIAAFTDLAERHFELRQQITRHEIERLRADLAARERELNDDDVRRSEWIRNMAERMVERLGRDRGFRGGDGRPGRDDRDDDDNERPGRGPGRP